MGQADGGRDLEVVTSIPTTPAVTCPIPGAGAKVEELDQVQDVQSDLSCRHTANGFSVRACPKSCGTHAWQYTDYMCYMVHMCTSSF